MVAYICQIKEYMWNNALTAIMQSGDRARIVPAPLNLPGRKQSKELGN